ncbi:glycosyltransferase family 2 protein [Enterococcus sp. LJL120]
MSNLTNQPALSVIVPVYNAEKFIDQCVSSILNNSFSDFELILIDDGSTDNSLKLLKKVHDSRIIILHHENHGVSYTRNRGIEVANGEYLVFIDSDDFIDLDYLETLYSSVQNFDVGISGIKYVNRDSRILKVLPIKDNSWQKFRLPLSGGKIYRRIFLIENHLNYSPYEIGEDLFFNLSNYANTEKVKIIEFIGYNYVENPHSVSRSKKSTFNVIPLLKDMINVGTNSPFIHQEELSFVLKKTLIDGILFNRRSLPVTTQKEILIAGNHLLKQQHMQLFQIEKNDSLIVNGAINIFALFAKLHLLSPFLWILSKL